MDYKTENYFYNGYRFLKDGKTVIGKLSDGDEFIFDVKDFKITVDYLEVK